MAAAEVERPPARDGAGIDPFREGGTWAPFGIGVAASLVFLVAFYGFGLLVSSFSRIRCSLSSRASSAILRSVIST